MPDQAKQTQTVRERLSLEDIKVHMASGQITEWVTVDAVAIAEEWKAGAEALNAELEAVYAEQARLREALKSLIATCRSRVEADEAEKERAGKSDDWEWEEVLCARSEREALIAAAIDAALTDPTPEKPTTTKI